MTKDEQIQQTLLRLKLDPKFYIEEFLRISVKKGEIIPFILNTVQKKVLSKIQELRAAGKPVRIIVLKARQTGISTLVSSIVFHNAVFNTNRTAFIVAHNKNSTQHLFRMTKMYYDYLPNDYKPMTRYNNRYELTFENPDTKEIWRNPGLRSSIRVETAGNLQAGRSFTIQTLFISELSFWERAEEVMTGLMQSVPNTPDSMVIVESTANGMDGYYYKLWTDAVEGKNDFTAIFIPWWELEEYTLQAPGDFELIDYEHQDYSNEKQIQELYGLTLDQMYWRRSQIKNSHNNNLQKFNQEYPDSSLTAFISTGNSIFDKHLIEKYQAKVKEPIAIGNLIFEEEKKEDGTFDFISKKKVRFEPNSKGKLKIWKLPEPDNRYVIGADSAEGIATSTDPSCAEVLDKKNKEQVAEWNAYIKPDEFAAELIKLGIFYNTAQIAVEANAHGLTVLYVMKENAYPRIYYRRNMNARGSEPGREPGWKTTGKTKALMIDTLVRDMGDEDILINGREVLSEMVHYVETQKDFSSRIKMGSSGDYHDDRIISLAIANITWSSLPLFINDDEVNKEYKANKYTGY